MGISDVYYQHPDVPAEQSLQRQTANFGALPQLREQYLQQQQQQQEMDFNNSNITPEQEAVMALQADDANIPEIAARYKARLGNGVQGQGQGQNINNNTTGFSGPSIQPSSGMMPGGPENMPRVATSMPQAFGSGVGGPSQGAPMTQRQYAQLMPQLGQIAQQGRTSRQDNIQLQNTNQENEKQRRSQQYLQLMKGDTQEEVAGGNNQARADIAAQKAELEQKKLEHQQNVLEFNKQKETAKLDERRAYHKRYLDILENKASEYNKYLSSKGTKDQILTGMISEFNARVSAFAKRKSSIPSMTPKEMADLDEEKKVLDTMQKQIEERRKHVENNPSSTESGASGSSGQKVKFTIGQKINHKGVTKTVTGVDANGRITSTDPP
jgi:hypothetical protein